MKGVYCLLIEITKDAELEIGKLGFLRFEKGFYVYVGSALTNLEKRVGRHIKTSKKGNKKFFWHIDYLLNCSEVKLRKVFYKETIKREECSVAKEVSREGIPVPKFGSSDCKCLSHLFRVEKTPKFLFKTFKTYSFP